jgi:UDP-glucose 4-epimerase
VAQVAVRAAADLLAAYRNEHNVEFTALALAHVFGPRQRAERGVVAAYGAAAATGGSGAIEGDGRQTRDFIFVDDVVDAFVRAATRGSGLVLNIGTGVQTSIRQLHQVVFGDRPAVRAPARVAELGRFALSPVRARIHLGWAAFTPLSDGLALTLAAAAERVVPMP